VFKPLGEKVTEKFAVRGESFNLKCCWHYLDTLDYFDKVREATA